MVEMDATADVIVKAAELDLCDRVEDAGDSDDEATGADGSLDAAAKAAKNKKKRDKKKAKKKGAWKLVLSGVYAATRLCTLYVSDACKPVSVNNLHRIPHGGIARYGRRMVHVRLAAVVSVIYSQTSRCSCE